MRARSLLPIAIAIAMLLQPLASAAQQAPAIPKSASAAAKRDAQASIDALLSGNFERFASFMTPRVLSLVGGKDKLIATLRSGIEDMHAQGARMESASAGQPEQMMRAGRDLMTIIPVKQVASLGGSQILFSSHMLGVSSDNGKSWTFVDTMKLTPENVRHFVPNFNPAMKLPQNPEPTYVPAAAAAR